MLRSLTTLVLSFALPLVAEEQKAEDLRFFETKIRPLLAENCYECHGKEKQKHDLRLDNLGYILQGGASGPALVPGDPEGSLIYQAITHQHPEFQMPLRKEDKLSDGEIADIRKWIAMGAPWPQNEVIEPRKPGEFTAEERAWWSFQPLSEAALPEIQPKGDRVLGSVDQFVIQKLREADLPQAPKALESDLIRRLYYNLHGLPPTQTQLQTYLRSSDPEKFSKLVDELLASERYGLRWAQHWLDLVRYAESDGYRQDAYRDNSWHYRDYVVDSLNADKPYDQFVREQLAGDEIDPDNPQILVATGFLRHGIYEWNQSDIEMQRNLIIEEVTGLTSEVFLGMSFACAQCHDHKFDPILQEDYYRLKAFFEPLQWRDDLALATPQELENHEQAVAEWREEMKPLLDAWSEHEQKAEDKAIAKVLPFPPANVQEMWKKPASERTPYEQQVAYFVDRRIQHEIDKNLNREHKKSEAWEALKPAKASKPKSPPIGLVATDVSTQAPPTVLETRRGKKEIEPGFLTILNPGPAEIQKRPEINSTGRRTALANWITSPENPLTARVIVNRVWQYHFGRGLSVNASEFGTLGEEPTHPELLDWLAFNFIKNGWSLKWLHRQILSSHAYQQSSSVPPTSASNERDPGNRLLWRFRPQRLDAEQIRDTILMHSGQLDWTIKSGPSHKTGSPVRSLFIQKKRNSPDEFLRRFDSPAGFLSVSKRDATNTPLQSLLMVNSSWPYQQAKFIATQVIEERPSAEPSDLVSATIEKLYGRTATAEEVSLSSEFLADGLAAQPNSKYPESGSPTLPDPDHPSGEAINFTPGSAYESLRFEQQLDPPADFTVEAVTNLRSIYKNTAVRTLVSQWNGDVAHVGWSLGVTGNSKRFGKGELILQMTARDFQGEWAHHIVPSGIILERDIPYSIALAFHGATAPGQSFGGQVSFRVRDLSAPDSELVTKHFQHPLGPEFAQSDFELTVGGRDQTSAHLWDGTISHLRISPSALPKDALLPAPTSSSLDSAIELTAEDLADSKDFRWVSKSSSLPSTAERPEILALADFVHVLINSNEFLYLP